MTTTSSRCGLGSLCLVFCLALCNGETCQMTDMVGFKYPDSAPKNILIATTTLADCKTECLADGTCLAVALRVVCYAYTSELTPVAADGKTISKKSCTSITQVGSTPTTQSSSTSVTTDTETGTPTTQSSSTSVTTDTAPSCSFDVKVNTDGTHPSAVLTIPSESNCQKLCGAILECQVYEFASSQCNVYFSTPSTTLSAGSVIGEKVKCQSDDLSCCYNSKANTAATGTSPSLTVTHSVQSCERLCKALPTCVAYSFSANVCKVYTKTTMTEVSRGTNFNTKNDDCAQTGSVVGTFVQVCNTGCQSFHPTVPILVISYVVACFLSY